MTTVTTRYVLGIKTVSEANMREHWATKAKRVKAQRQYARAVCQRIGAPGMPHTVTLTRIAPRTLDDDNLRGALKAVRDGIADALAINDRDPRVRWFYTQEKGRPKEMIVTVEAEYAD